MTGAQRKKLRRSKKLSRRHLWDHVKQSQARPELTGHKGKNTMTEFAWHVHHKILIGLLTEPIEDRIRHITTEKAEEKTRAQIELHLRLFNKVKGPLPDKLIKAAAEWNEAKAEWNELEAEWDKAAADDRTTAELEKLEAEWDKAAFELEKAAAGLAKAKTECKLEIEALHNIECPGCPWDGRSIFN